MCSVCGPEDVIEWIFSQVPANSTGGQYHIRSYLHQHLPSICPVESKPWA